MGFAEGTPTVEIQLGGKSYTLGWTWGAKRRVRDALALRHPDQQSVNEEESLAAVLWASMEPEARASLLLEDVEEMISPANELDVAAKIRFLCLRSEPDPVKAEPVAVKEPTTGQSNSKKSGQLASTI